jgi:hypothetical protein
MRAEGATSELDHKTQEEVVCFTFNLPLQIQIVVLIDNWA